MAELPATSVPEPANGIRPAAACSVLAAANRQPAAAATTLLPSRAVALARSGRGATGKRGIRNT